MKTQPHSHLSDALNEIRVMQTTVHSLKKLIVGDRLFFLDPSERSERATVERQLLTTDHRREGFRRMVFSPDGRTLAAGVGNLIILWDVTSSSPKPSTQLKGHDIALDALAFSPSGATLASGSRDGVILVWDLAAGEGFRVVRSNASDVASLVFSANGKMLASCSSSESDICILDVASGVTSASLSGGHTSGVRCIAFNADGTVLASGGDDGKVTLWDVAEKTMKSTLVGHSRNVVYSVAFGAGEMLASAGNDDKIIVWDTTTGTAAKTMKQQDRTVWSRTSIQLALTGDGRTLVCSCSDENYVSLWDVATGTRSTTFFWSQLAGYNQSQGRMESVAITADGSLMATACTDYGIMLWDVHAGKVAITLDAVKSKDLQALAFVPQVAVGLLRKSGTLTVCGPEFAGSKNYSLEWNVPHTHSVHVSAACLRSFGCTSCICTLSAGGGKYSQSDWPDSISVKCGGCMKEFSLFRRKHHCRGCGAIACSSCLTEKSMLCRRCSASPSAESSKCFAFEEGTSSDTSDARPLLSLPSVMIGGRLPDVMVEGDHSMPQAAAQAALLLPVKSSPVYGAAPSLAEAAVAFGSPVGSLRNSVPRVAERKAKEEDDRRAKAAAERQAKEESGRKAKTEHERKAKEEAERQGKEEDDRRAKAEAERQRKEEDDRRAKAEAERQGKEEAEGKAKEEVDATRSIASTSTLESSGQLNSLSEAMLLLQPNTFTHINLSPTEQEAVRDFVAAVAVVSANRGAAVWSQLNAALDVSDAVVALATAYPTSAERCEIQRITSDERGFAQLYTSMQRHLNIGFNIAVQLCGGKVQVETASIPARVLAATVDLLPIPCSSLVSKAVLAVSELRSKRQYQHLDMLLGALDPRKQGMLSEKIARCTVISLVNGDGSPSTDPLLSANSSNKKNFLRERASETAASLRDLLCGRERTTVEARGEKLALAALSHVLDGKLAVEPLYSSHGSFYSDEQYDEVASELARAALGYDVPVSASATSEADHSTAMQNRESETLVEARGNFGEVSLNGKPTIELAGVMQVMARYAEEIERLKVQAGEVEQLKRETALMKERHAAEIDALRRQAAATDKTAKRAFDALDLDNSSANVNDAGDGLHQQQMAQRVNTASAGARRAGAVSERVLHVEVQQGMLSDDVETLRQELLLHRERFARLEEGTQPTRK